MPTYHKKVKEQRCHILRGVCEVLGTIADLTSDLNWFHILIHASYRAARSWCLKIKVRVSCNINLVYFSSRFCCGVQWFGRENFGVLFQLSWCWTKVETTRTQILWIHLTWHLTNFVQHIHRPQIRVKSKYLLGEQLLCSFFCCHYTSACHNTSKSSMPKLFDENFLISMYLNIFDG